MKKLQIPGTACKNCQLLTGYSEAADKEPDID